MIADINHFIDAVYVINMPNAEKRFKRFLSDYKNFDHPNLIRFEGVDGNSLNIPNWPGNLGSLGCRQSHINLLKTAEEKGYKSFIVFEDDAMIPKNFKGKLQEFIHHMPDDWDMAYLYAEIHYLETTPVNEHVIKLNNTLSLVAILYNGKCLDIVLDKVENDLRWIDSSIADLHQQLNVYAPSKSIAGHSDGYSYIENKYMRQNKTFKNYIIQKFKNLIHKISKI